MTGNNLLLDSNIVIELFKGNVTVAANFESLTAVNIPFIVLGELYFGAYRSANPAKHIAQINGFLNKCNVLYGDEETANYYTQIKTSLLKKGKPIPENDIWIAAIANQYQFILATRDNHFNEVNTIATIFW